MAEEGDDFSKNEETPCEHGTCKHGTCKHGTCKHDAGDFEVNSLHELRGDYSLCNENYIIKHNLTSYTPEMQKRWQRLFKRQSVIVQSLAIKEFNQGLDLLSCENKIPDLQVASEFIKSKTGWSLVCVPGLIPNDVFFRLLSQKKFPVTDWLREEHEMDYLVEPDIFHDFFGHVPLLSNQNYANYMERYGQCGLRAIEDKVDNILARLYWYTVEFGLYLKNNKLQAYGAGMLSSKDETDFSVNSPKPLRIKFNLERILTTNYMVDDFQKNYFIVEDFHQLFSSIENDINKLLLHVKSMPTIKEGLSIEGDEIYQI